MIPEVSEIESQSRVPSLRQLPDKESPPRPIQEEKPEAGAGSGQQLQKGNRQKRISEEVFRAKELLRKEWGESYMQKLIELTPLTVHLEITLHKHP